MSDKKLTHFNRDEKLLLLIPAIQKISDIFLSAFFISFIMQNATNQIVGVALYKFLFYTFIAAGFIFLAKYCKIYDKTNILRLYPIIKIIILTLIIYLGKNSVNYIIPLGILYGIMAAFFNLPINTLTGEKVSAYKTSYFFGIKNVCISTVKIVSPVLLGIFITKNSYVETAYFLLFLSFFELFLPSFFTKSYKSHKEPTKFNKCINIMKKDKTFRLFFLEEILRGFSVSGVLSTLITMYTIYLFHTDLNLGIFTSIFAICSIITSLLFGRYILKKHYPTFTIVSSIFVLFSICSFVFNPTQETFLLYNFICATAVVIISHISEVNTYNISKQNVFKNKYKLEFFVIRDIALYIGRFICFGALLFIGILNKQEWLKYYLVLVTLSIFLMSYISAKIAPHVKGR